MTPTMIKLRNALNELDTYREGTPDDPQAEDPVMVDHDNCFFELNDPDSGTRITLADLYALVEEAQAPPVPGEVSPGATALPGAMSGPGAS